MSRIDTAILLAAGQGTRLRARAASKPLCLVAGKPLLDHALDSLAVAGFARAIVVTGYLAEKIEAHVAARPARGIAVETVRTPDCRQPNGVSVAAAAPLMNEAGAVMAMCDHLVVPALYERLATAGHGGGLRLGIDRRVDHRWVDPEDVTRVRMAGDRIVAIGKGLAGYDANDTGVFAIGPAFMAALAALSAPSVSEGVMALAAQGSAFIADCSDLDWLDVDDEKALGWAEEWMATGPVAKSRP